MTNCIIFLSNEDIISTHQSGFRSLRSTVTALVEATDNWAFNIDRGNINAVVFLDLKKAFTLLIMISFYLKWTFTEYKELLFIGLDRIWQIIRNDISLMIRFLESGHLNAGYLREQSLVPFYFLFTSTIC